MYVYPDDWSRPALMFAVNNGILKGDQHYNLNPEKNITRGEMAAVLVRLLGATDSADLSGFTDLDPKAWYFQEVSAAVAAGIFNGTSHTAFSPNTPITREQAMVVLCRTFGIVTSNGEAWKGFSDSGAISDYARFAVGAMKELGLVTGYRNSDGTYSVKPQKTITRAEVAQLLYNLLDAIVATPGEMPPEGCVLYRGTEPLPEDLSLEGTLILGQSVPTELEISHWNVTRSLVIRTRDGIDLDLSGLVTPQLVICAAGAVTANVNQVWLGGKGVTYRGNAVCLGTLLGDHSARGSYSTVLLHGGSLAIDGTARELELGPDCKASLNSSCHSITLGQNAAMSLEGSCDGAVIGRRGQLQLTGTCQTLTLAGAGALVKGTFPTVEVNPSAGGTLTGNCRNLSAGKGAVLTLEGDVAETLIAGEGSQVTLKGDVRQLLPQKRSRVTVEGSITGSMTTAEAPEITVSGNVNKVTLGKLAKLTVQGTGGALFAGPSSEITLGGTGTSLTLTGTGVTAKGSFTALAVNASAGGTVTGNCQTVSVGKAAALTLQGDVADTLTAGENSQVTLKGDVRQLLPQNYSKVTVEGSITASMTTAQAPEITVKGNVNKVTLGKQAKLTVHGNAGTLSAGSSSTVTVGGTCKKLETNTGASVTVKGRCTTVKMGSSATLNLNGADTVTMTGNGKLTAKGHIKLLTMDKKDVLTLNGTADKIEAKKTGATLKGSGRAKVINLYEQGCSCSLAADQINQLWRTPYDVDYDNALKEVKTMRVPCTVQYATNLYAQRSLTGYLTTIPKGATVYNERNPSDGSLKVSYTDANGKYWVGWTSRNACTIHTGTTTTQGTLDYSEGTKEGFVDGKGYDSSTDYLIWVSRYTQKVMVFKGSKGNWNLIKTMPCASGSNYTPTPAGTYTIESHVPRWYFSDYYTDHVSVFYGGHAFHSILINYDDTICDGRVGLPLSHGCVRMLVEDCKYIYTLPTGTRVVIW